MAERKIPVGYRFRNLHPTGELLGWSVVEAEVSEVIHPRFRVARGDLRLGGVGGEWP